MYCMSANFHRFACIIYIYRTTACNTTFAHSASNNSSVRCRSTACRKYSFTSFHSENILGASFDTHKYNLFAITLHCFSTFGREYNLADCSPWRCIFTTSNNICITLCFGIKRWVKKLVEIVCTDTAKCFFFCNTLFVYQVDSYFDCGMSGAFTIACL